MFVEDGIYIPRGDWNCVFVVDGEAMPYSVSWHGDLAEYEGHVYPDKRRMIADVEYGSLEEMFSDVFDFRWLYEPGRIEFYENGPDDFDGRFPILYSEDPSARHHAYAAFAPETDPFVSWFLRKGFAD